MALASVKVPPREFVAGVTQGGAITQSVVNSIVSKVVALNPILSVYTPVVVGLGTAAVILTIGFVVIHLNSEQCDCPEGKEYNPSTQECECIPKVCPPGFILDPDTCECIEDDDEIEYENDEPLLIEVISSFEGNETTLLARTITIGDFDISSTDPVTSLTRSFGAAKDMFVTTTNSMDVTVTAGWTTVTDKVFASKRVGWVQDDTVVSCIPSTWDDNTERDAALTDLGSSSNKLTVYLRKYTDEGLGQRYKMSEYSLPPASSVAYPFNSPSYCDRMVEPIPEYDSPCTEVTVTVTSSVGVVTPLGVRFRKKKYSTTSCVKSPNEALGWITAYVNTLPSNEIPKGPVIVDILIVGPCEGC